MAHLAPIGVAFMDFGGAIEGAPQVLHSAVQLGVPGDRCQGAQLLQAQPAHLPMEAGGSLMGGSGESDIVLAGVWLIGEAIPPRTQGIGSGGRDQEDGTRQLLSAALLT